MPEETPKIKREGRERLLLTDAGRNGLPRSPAVDR
jgi:hypothetical protein